MDGPGSPHGCRRYFGKKRDTAVATDKCYNSEQHGCGSRDFAFSLLVHFFVETHNKVHWKPGCGGDIMGWERT